MLPKLLTETRNNSQENPRNESCFTKLVKKVKRLHLPTDESPFARKVCVNKDSEQSAHVAKRGLVFAASRGENVTRNINAVEEKEAHNPTTELRNINLQENSIPSINKQFSQ